MNSEDKPVSWVIYLMTVKQKPEGMKAVCQQSEWDAMELARPGCQPLVQAGIANEGEAEKLARGVPPPGIPSALKRRLR